VSNARPPARSSRLWHSKQYCLTTAQCDSLEWDRFQSSAAPPAAVAIPTIAIGMMTLAEMALPLAWAAASAEPWHAPRHIIGARPARARAACVKFCRMRPTP
jgi:hypothetical protein